LLKQEVFTLDKPTVTMLTATNDAHMGDLIGKREISGGYIARTFVINAIERHRLNPLIIPLENPPDYDILAKFLKEASTLKGPFKEMGSLKAGNGYDIQVKRNGREVFFTPAGKLYEDWYMDFYTRVDESLVKDETGTDNRFGDSVIKVAMLLAIAGGIDPGYLEINLQAMDEAIEKCGELLGAARKATYGKSQESEANKDAKLKSILLRDLLNRPGHSITRVELLQKYMMEANAEVWENVINTLSDARVVYREQPFGEIIYRMPDDIVLRFQESFKEKGKK